MSNAASPGPPEAELAAAIDRAYDLIFEGNLDLAESVLDKAERQAQAAGFRRQVIRSIYWRSYVVTLRGEHFLAEQQLAGALRLAEEEGDNALIAGIHFAVARIHHQLGRLHDAESALELALMHANNSHDLRREADVYGLAADCRISLGMVDEAYEYLKAGVVLFRSMTDEQVALIWLLLELSRVAFELGYDEAAAAAFAEATAVGSDQRFAHSISKAYFQLSWQAILAGDLDVAAANLEHALQLAGPPIDPGSEMEQDAILGRFLLATGRPDEARTRFEHAIELAQATHRRFSVAESRLELARALLALGEMGPARATLIDAEVAFEMFGARTLLCQACCLWVQYYLAEGRPDTAEAALARARKIAGQLKPYPSRTLAAELAKAEAALSSRDS